MLCTRTELRVLWSTSRIHKYFYFYRFFPFTSSYFRIQCTHTRIEHLHAFSFLFSFSVVVVAFFFSNRISRNFYVHRCRIYVHFFVFMHANCERAWYVWAGKFLSAKNWMNAYEFERIVIFLLDASKFWNCKFTSKKFDIKWMLNAYGCRRLCRQIQCQIASSMRLLPESMHRCEQSTGALANANALQYCKTFLFIRRQNPNPRCILWIDLSLKCNSINIDYQFELASLFPSAKFRF